MRDSQLSDMIPGKPPDDQRCIRTSGRGWRCGNRKKKGLNLCEKHYLNSVKNRTYGKTVLSPQRKIKKNNHVKNDDVTANKMKKKIESKSTTNNGENKNKNKKKIESKPTTLSDESKNKKNKIANKPTTSSDYDDDDDDDDDSSMNFLSLQEAISKISEGELKLKRKLKKAKRIAKEVKEEAKRSGMRANNAKEEAEAARVESDRIKKELENFRTSCKSSIEILKKQVKDETLQKDIIKINLEEALKEVSSLQTEVAKAKAEGEASGSRKFITELPYWVNRGYLIGHASVLKKQKVPKDDPQWADFQFPDPSQAPSEEFIIAYLGIPSLQRTRDIDKIDF